MAIYDYLPKFNYIEPNNLKGLQPGFVVAQVEDVDSSLLKDGMMENGKICALEVKEGKLTIVPATAEHKVLYVHYTEPLNTIYNSDKFFAVKVADECPRLVQLIPGDEWMSTDANCEIEGRIVKVSAEKGWYSVDTMANGDEGFHYVFLG
jgi:hypothetical protein